jgi:microtubule-associated protein-like 6
MSISSKKLVSASASLGIEWNTWTCIFGFNVQGIWPPASTGYVVNYTCLSNNKKVLATGDDFSTVKLYKNPCTVTHARYKEYKGHSSHVPKIRFSKNDVYLISVGGNDKCVFVWETDFAAEGEENDEGNAEENNQDGENLIENQEDGGNNEENPENNDQEMNENNKDSNNDQEVENSNEQEEEEKIVEKKPSTKKPVVAASKVKTLAKTVEKPSPKKKQPNKKQMIDEDNEGGEDV